jgi:alkaline phosphatase
MTEPDRRKAVEIALGKRTCGLAGVAVFLGVTVIGCGATAAPGSTGAASPAALNYEAPRNIILYIGDGVGTAYWTAALFARDSLAVRQMRVMGLTDTRAADQYVTDSAAGATVYATGERTYNGAIGVGMRCRELFAADSTAVMRNPAECDPLEGVFDIAYRRGLATGLVATSSVTHATPASFGAKVPFRRMEPEIASQLAAAPIDVLLGGGRGFFDGALRPDSTDLLTPLCLEAACPSTAAELQAYSADDRRLIGLFANQGMRPAESRRPTLPEMTRVALERVSRNRSGFFLMVEGSQPDWRGHDNRPVDEVTAEMLDFDDAIGVGLEFARADPNTLVLVVSDHETGGLSLVAPQGQLEAIYSTGNHTATMTPHFAFGVGEERFSGIMQNDEIGRILVEMVSAR